ncbi:methyl-accepting chemotaxis protein (plasmid) [Pseudomonas sp. BYT-5]|uniref:methyl-accepting chemotaxis protein n=1 Tax=unclassified Pseudomonas TaxID=196821 RepID=UPI0020207C53|nr:MULTISPECIES: methyl-accepting chemotaxis protein [unclassified Pseudomonas]URD45493.1 methyl-accepting chemotaxis protein [Pseudomonas sp. BYT-5]URL00680.1 methyl-accepting chemotaxis protein [Pseudomonas sp. BYT-1]
METLERLSLPGKFALLGLLALILIAAPTTLYLLGALDQGRQTAQEARGVEPIHELLLLVQKLQEHSYLSSTVLSGNRTLDAARQGNQAEVDRAFSQTENALQEAQVAPETMAALRQVKQQWNSLTSQIDQATIDTPQSLSRHSKLIDACLKIEDLLLDHFELSLDPVFETYYLIAGALVELPRTSELLGKLRATGAQHLALGEIHPEQRAVLTNQITQALEGFDKMARALAKVSKTAPSFRSWLEPSLAELHPRIKKALSLTESQLLSTSVLNYPASEYVATYTEATDALFALNQQAQEALDKALEARNNSNRQNIILMTIALLVLLLVGGSYACWMSLSLCKQLTVALTAAERINEGDLSQPINVLGKDEAARLLQALQRMQEGLRGTVKHIQATAERLDSTARELNATTVDATSGLNRQCGQIDLAAAAVTELTMAIDDVARSAASASEASQSAEVQSQQGLVGVSRTVDSITSLSDDIELTSESLQVLAGKIGDIGSVLDVIRGIAEQTNLLALNAAIEAARAGESGRGFAVVADEVRALALRTQESTMQIEEIISSVKQGSQGALGAMESSKGKTRDTLAIAREAGVTLNAIADSITKINDRNLSIASATEEQSYAAREVDSNLLNIRDVSAETSAGANQTQASTRELASLANELNGMVKHFIV